MIEIINISNSSELGSYKNEPVTICDQFKKSIVRKTRTVQVKEECAIFAPSYQVLSPKS